MGDAIFYEMTHVAGEARDYKFAQFEGDTAQIWDNLVTAEGKVVWGPKPLIRNGLVGTATELEPVEVLSIVTTSPTELKAVFYSVKSDSMAMFNLKKVELT